MRVEYKIREIRNSKGLSIRDLEKRSGISRSLISNYENGHSHPSILKLAQIALVLHVEIQDLYKLYK